MIHIDVSHFNLYLGGDDRNLVLHALQNRCCLKAIERILQGSYYGSEECIEYYRKLPMVHINLPSALPKGGSDRAKS